MPHLGIWRFTLRNWTGARDTRFAQYDPTTTELHRLHYDSPASAAQNFLRPSPIPIFHQIHRGKIHNHSNNYQLTNKKVNCYMNSLRFPFIEKKKESSRKIPIFLAGNECQCSAAVLHVLADARALIRPRLGRPARLIIISDHGLSIQLLRQRLVREDRKILVGKKSSCHNWELNPYLLLVICL